MDGFLDPNFAERQDSPVNKSLKKQAREPWNERKGFMVLPISIEHVLLS